MSSLRKGCVTLSGVVLATATFAQPPGAPPVAPGTPATPGVQDMRLADPMILAEDPSPLASKLTVEGKKMGNGTFRVRLRYEPGRGVKDVLGEEGLERLSFLVYSEPSRSLLALFHCGGDAEEAAALGAEHGALNVVALPWGGSLEGTTYLPGPPESDHNVTVEMLAFDRRARVLAAGEQAAGVGVNNFTASSYFREMSLLESGEPEG